MEEGKKLNIGLNKIETMSAHMYETLATTMTEVEIHKHIKIFIS
jgi:hypothetical protein